MEISTENGTKITYEMFEKLADAYESGNWPGVASGEITIGQPRLKEDDARAITFRIPVSKVVALDKLAETQGISRSEVLRKAVECFLNNVSN